MNERAERAIIIRGAGHIVAGRRGRARRCFDPARGLPAQAVEMNVPEREHELERKRKERNARTRSQTRTNPMHAATSLVADTCSRRCRSQNFSYNVTFRQSVVRE